MIRVNLRYMTPTHRKTSREFRDFTGCQIWDRRRALSEERVEAFLCSRFRKLGVRFERQVPIVFDGKQLGIADVMTDTLAIEVKTELDRTSIFRGMGQALIFGMATGKRPVLLGRSHEETERMRPFVERAGVRLVTVDDGPFILFPENMEDPAWRERQRREAERLHWENFDWTEVDAEADRYWAEVIGLKRPGKQGAT